MATEQQDPAPAYSAQLTLAEGNAQPETLPLEKEKPASIGRHRTNQIVLLDEHASRHHAEVYFKDDCWYVRDIGALNRTQVNGKAILGPTPLPADALIKVGRTVLQFTVTRPPHQPADWYYPDIDDEQSSSFNLQTLPLPDELTFLYQFNSQALKAKSSRELVLLALQTLAAGLSGDAALYTGLEESETGLPSILPENPAQPPSEQLIREVHERRKSVWIHEPGQEREILASLGSVGDALGLPVGVLGPPIGMLHVYRASGRFTDRNVRFCELLAGSLSHWIVHLQNNVSLAAERDRLRAQLAQDKTLIGNSTVMHQLREQIQLAARRESSVLIIGESGVGKELVAAAVHQESLRSDRPLIAVNVAAISRDLFEAELFGHRKGAFNGAFENRIGLFPQADGGTLFLDEIGELPLHLQPALLRALEEKTYRPVGCSTEFKANVRIIAATNRDLRKEAAAGRFREDLFYRLETLTLHVPPLRGHLDDLPALVDQFLKLSKTNGRRLKLDSDVLPKLMSYSWPGNVRQLRTAVERAVSFARGNVLRADDFLLEAPESRTLFVDLNLEHIIESAIRQALLQTNGNKTRAAQLLGIARDTLIKRMKKHGIGDDELDL
jgi:transcriptional regulator with GAF, ATPase, and Fis domain